MKITIKNLTGKVLGLLFVLILFASYSCDGRDDDSYPNILIIKELPKITYIGRHNESVIVQSQDELETVFNETELEQIESLQGVDFSKYSLLLGYGTYGNEVTNLEHYFSKTGKDTYTYLIKIGGLATRPDFFRYGILVSKLPESTKVNFKIEELK